MRRLILLHVLFSPELTQPSLRDVDFKSYLDGYRLSLTILSVVAFRRSGLIHVMLPVLDQSCCGCSLHTGTKVIASVGAVRAPPFI